jgi:hypothetical protein
MNQMEPLTRNQILQIAVTILGAGILIVLLCFIVPCHAECAWDKAAYVLIVGPVEHVCYVEPIRTQVSVINDGTWRSADANDGWTFDSLGNWTPWPKQPDYFRVFYFETLGGLSDYLSRNFVGSAVLVNLRGGKLSHVHQAEISEPDTVIQSRVKGYEWEAK